ncbi:helix-turn-helix domain-containing protein [Streptomyces sp. ISL-36]|uniref:MmyB family transcriptional regulator n=1 Tax=Streptomyces sp. ISL-36 TaxID=2819182 RepID=UPI001BEA0C6F|nr:helix-turn-helix domain-containing protein [Streptomyces sp. ISL-36]MBT2444157.1 helix-turn-helix domain-containing protein [Streptomyces sp. ISL-36]
MTDTHRLALRRALGTFLRAHRERIAPSDVGLPTGGRRRTPGLRREEAAALSGVGVAWYTWLEQGRVDTSREVLDAVSRTLRLDTDAHHHVLRLAGFAPPETVREPALDPALLEGWPDSPAILLDGVLHMTAWNTAYTRLWPDPAAVPTARRNLLLLLATDPEYQRLLPDWEPQAMDLHRYVRTGADTRPGDPAVRALTSLLAAERPDLETWWTCRSVGAFTSRTVRITGAGPYTLSMLHTPDAPGSSILLFSPDRARGDVSG